MLVLFLACTADSTDTKSEVDPDAPTWYADVAPIVQESCSGCHQPGGAAFDLTNPETAAAMAQAMASAVQEQRMPPWGAFETDTCAPTRPWVGDRRLADVDIATLAAWAEGGAPVGDPAADLTPASPEALTGNTVDLLPPAAYTTRAAADELICLVIDPGLTEDLWVDGIEVIPENRGIAHHTLVMLDPSAASDALVNEDGWYDCERSLGLTDPALLATWVPGSGPTYAPEGTGMRIPAGSRIVMQMHYHPAGVAGEVDRPTLRVRELASAARYELHNTLIGNAPNEAAGLLPGPNDDGVVEFRIPANVAGHTEEMYATFDYEFPNLPIPTVGAHMHLIGTSMEVWIERATPDAGEPEQECLLSASRYEYDWQQLYRYEGDLTDMPMVSGGDSLRIRCTYDNTLDHEGTRRALEDAGLDAPVDVYLGEGTLDEMCIGMFGYVY